MSDQGPYAPPTTPVQPPPSPGGAVTPRMIELSNSTRWWVLFLAILSTLATGMMFLAAAMMGVIGASISEEAGVPGGLLVAVYVVMGLLYLVITWKMWQMFLAMLRFKDRPETTTLENVLLSHRGFWRTAGLMAATFIVLYFGAIFVAVIVGLGAAS